MRKIIVTGVPARQQLATGAMALYKAVAATAGPYGKNFFLDKKDKITNDGVTIAREFQLQNEVQNRGCKAIREAAIKTVDQVGDGTTTAIILAYKIYEECARFLGKEGVIGQKTSAELIRQIDSEKEEIIEKLIALAQPILTKEELIASATVAVEDTELGKLLGETQWDLGKEGYILAEKTAERVSSIERVHGIRIDNGFGTSQIINNQEKQTLEVTDEQMKTGIILTSHTIKTLEDWNVLMKIFEPAFKGGYRQIVVVARAWTDETVSYCLQNINKGSLKIYPLSGPYTDMQERFKDLAAVTGATFYDSESSELGDIFLSGIGGIERVTARRMEALIAGKNDEKSEARIDTRVKELEEKEKGSESDFEKKNLAERIAQLKNGFAIAKVGSFSDMERERLYDKCEDGVHAVRAAFQEGTVKGAGLAFKEISDALPDTYLLKRPLRAVNEQIMSLAPADFVVEDWVRDPVKVCRIALENACAAASAFATAEGVITEEFPKRLDELLGGTLRQ